MSNVEKFRDLFIEFEKITIDHEKIKPESRKCSFKEAMNLLKEMRINPYYSDYNFLDYCRICRNQISHDNKVNYIEFNEDLINKLVNIIEQIKHPYNVYSKSTKNITSATSEDNVKEYMVLMNEKNYTHIPIYENDSLIGIFSENCIFNYLLDEEIIQIDNNTKFKDIKEYIELSNSEDSVKFKKKDELYDDVVAEFIKNFKNGKKLSCIMVTQNGKTTEKVIGILTTWDIIGR